MSTQYKSADIKCPFYLAMEQQQMTMRCEGLEKGSSTCLRFKGKKQFEGHMEEYCMRMEGFPQCGLYKALEQKFM